MKIHHINTPLTDEIIADLKVGDQVKLSGVIYTARDAAHKRLVELIKEGKELPVDLRGQVIYYAGPCPPKPDQIIGPTGPTSAYRMDPFTPTLYEYGVKGTIGKGPRTPAIKQSCQDHQAVHFSAVAGISALLARRIKKVETMAYEDLGTEAIQAYTIEEFPLIVCYDMYRNDLYDQEISKYKNYKHMGETR